MISWGFLPDSREDRDGYQILGRIGMGRDEFDDVSASVVSARGLGVMN